MEEFTNIDEYIESDYYLRLPLDSDTIAEIPADAPVYYLEADAHCAGIYMETLCQFIQLHDPSRAEWERDQLGWRMVYWGDLSGHYGDGCLLADIPGVAASFKEFYDQAERDAEAERAAEAEEDPW